MEEELTEAVLFAKGMGRGGGGGDLQSICCVLDSGLGLLVLGHLCEMLSQECSRRQVSESS